MYITLKPNIQKCIIGKLCGKSQFLGRGLSCHWCKLQYKFWFFTRCATGYLFSPSLFLVLPEPDGVWYSLSIGNIAYYYSLSSSFIPAWISQYLWASFLNNVFNVFCCSSIISSSFCMILVECKKPGPPTSHIIL